MTNPDDDRDHPVTLEVLELFQRRGGSRYGGESVTQLEHALQAALFARRDGASAALVVAALLHDVGHLLHALPDEAPDDGLDDHHERLAEAWLRRRFPAEVAQPVALHVEAKRYLCTVEPDYLTQLSGPSLTSLRLQGGLMSASEQAEFERRPHYEAAVRLRRYDDAAKVVGLRTPELGDFARDLNRVLVDSSLSLHSAAD